MITDMAKMAYHAFNAFVFGPDSDSWRNRNAAPSYEEVKAAGFGVPLELEDEHICMLVKQGDRRASKLAERLSYELYVQRGSLPLLSETLRESFGRQLTGDKSPARSVDLRDVYFKEGQVEATAKVFELRAQAVRLLDELQTARNPALALVMK